MMMRGWGNVHREKARVTEVLALKLTLRFQGSSCLQKILDRCVIIGKGSLQDVAARKPRTLSKLLPVVRRGHVAACVCDCVYVC